MAIPFGITICKPTMNDEIKNFRRRIFNSLQQELSKNFVQEPTTTTTTENYRHFRGGFQHPHRYVVLTSLV